MLALYKTCCIIKKTSTIKKTLFLKLINAKCHKKVLHIVKSQTQWAQDLRQNIISIRGARLSKIENV
jgi:hypothetical protein